MISPSPRRFPRMAMLALVCCLLTTDALWACSDRTSHPLDWDRCWSPLRWGIWLLLLLPAAGITFMMFRGWLDPKRTDAPWPRTALGRALSLWWLMAGFFFLLLFAVVSDELRHTIYRILPPGWAGSFFNLHWPWLAILALTLGGAWFLQHTIRHPDEATT